MGQPIGFLLWADIEAGHEPAFNEWYNREHAPDRVLRIPGFVQARRFVAVAGGPRYAVLYEIAGPEVFREPAYLAMRGVPDPRSQQFIPLFRRVIRFVGRPAAEAAAVKGAIEGGWVRFSAFESHPAIAGAQALPDFVATLVRRPGILRARVFEAVPELMEGAVRNMRGTVRESLRGPDRLPGAVLVIEASAEGHLVEAEAGAARAIEAAGCGATLDTARMQQLLRIART